MDKKAKELFDANPKLEAVYKVKGKSIYFRSSEKADAFQQLHLVEIETLKKEDHSAKEHDADGLPDKNWKNDQIKAWMNTNEVPYEDSDVKATLLDKVEQFLKSKETE